MKIEGHTSTRSLELRVLELEDTVALMASILGTTTEMLGKIGEITDHCAETILGVTGAIPGTIQRVFPSRPVGHRSGAEETPPSSSSRCSCGPS